MTDKELAGDKLDPLPNLNSNSQQNVKTELPIFCCRDPTTFSFWIYKVQEFPLTTYYAGLFILLLT